MRRSPLLARITLASALVASTGQSALAQCPDGTPRPCGGVRAAALTREAVPPLAVRARRLLVLPFRNVTQQPAQAWLTSGAALMLGETLGQYQDLTVVGDDRLTAARRRLKLPPDREIDAAQVRQLAAETGGWTAIAGSVYATGPTLRLDVTATDVPTGKVATRATAVIGAATDPRVAIDSLVARLLAPSGIAVDRTASAAVSTASADAYQAYARARELEVASNYAAANKGYREATRLDSTFALAWARMAYTAFYLDPFALFAPGGEAQRAIATARRLGTRLAPRSRALVLAMADCFGARWSDARRRLDSLVATDANDLDARELYASMLGLDFEVDTTVTPRRLVSSPNRMFALVREILARDPGRVQIHASIANLLATAAGWGFGVKLGIAGGGSFLTSYQRVVSRGADVTAVPVLEDTIRLEPASVFMQRPVPERLALRRAAARAGMEWVTRWLDAAPTDPEAHLWASRMLETLGAADSALAELDRGSSLGAPPTWDNRTSRRLALLLAQGRRTAALAIADSLRAARALTLPLVPYYDRTLGQAFAAFGLAGRWATADSVLQGLPKAAPGKLRCDDVIALLGTGTSEFHGPVVRALADSAARHATDLFALPAVAPCAERLITLPNAGDGPPRTEAAKWLRDEANTSNGETASRLRALADKVH